MALLEITDLRTEIQLKEGVVHAVDGVTLQVDEGETLGVVGESGCGKTMTALTIMQLLPNGGRIAGGSIKLGGRELTGLKPDDMRKIRGDDIGMIFQDPLSSLNPTHTVGWQIAEAVLLHREVSKKEALDRAVEVLDLVGMPRARERVDEYPHQFSGGMRQRVMIAMALACDPKLLIADEPTTALDVTIQKQILELIDDLRRRLGMAVIMVTHDLGVIAGRADRVAVMYAGKVVETTETSSLYANPRHPYTEALFHALPEKSAETRERLYSIPGAPPDLVNPPKGCRFAPRCQYATDKCRTEAPDLAGETTAHTYRCFFPVGAKEQAVAGHLTVVEPAVAAEEVLLDEQAVGGVVLEAKDLVKDFPVTKGMLQRKVGTVSAVAGVSFDIRKGETLGLVGESGCGKTTIGRMLVGLDKPTSGSVLFGGTDLARSSGRQYRRERRDIQYMFQDSYASLDPRMRAGSILREPLIVQGMGSRHEQQAKVREMLGKVGLPESWTERYPHEFSGGQRQRLGFARALLLDPQVIVADEPVSALDVSVQAQVLNMMSDLQRELGLTYMFISHDLSVVRYLSNHIGVMYLGKLVEIGTADEVYLRPAHPYTKGLIESAPTADPATERAKVHAGITGELPSAIHPPSGCRFRTRCPIAQEICSTVEPELKPYGVAKHMAACHFALQPPVEATAPAAAEQVP
ncbi:MAG: peptide/nickel transport system ATP-binding protein ddpF [Trebonia sp.]|nr:peptide/nickel transport system ATP-binding protein ddpF [Trebonia sp.]